MVAISFLLWFSVGDEHCEVRKVNGSLPPYWGWLDDAKYAGQRVVREETLDVWVQRVRKIEPVFNAFY